MVPLALKLAYEITVMEYCRSQKVVIIMEYCRSQKVVPWSDSTHVKNWWWLDSGHVFTEWLHSSTVNDSSQSHFYKFSKHLIDKPSSFAHKDISFFLRWWSKFLFWLCLLAVLWCILSIKCSTKYGGRAESLLFLLRGWGARSAPFFRVSLRAVKSHNLINTHVFLRLYR